MNKVELNNISINSGANQHYERLTNKSNGFISPLESLQDWIDEGRLAGDNLRLVQDVKNQLKDIVEGKPKDLRNFITIFGEVTDLDFSNDFINKLRYNSFRKNNRAITFIKSFNLKSCPYCNTQYIISLNTKGKLLCHFDHIYPKMKYPYLSISYYNLLPSCSYCNQMKSEADPFLDSSFKHPYEQSISDKFKFKATDIALKNYTSRGRTKREDKNIKVIVEKGENIKFHLDTFKIEEIHNEHHDVIDEIYLKSLIYNSSYYEELKRKYVDDKGWLTMGELKRVIYGNYMHSSDINKRPLSKMTQDILEQFNKLRLKK